MSFSSRTADWRMAALLLATLTVAACAGINKKHTGVAGGPGSEAALPKSAELSSYFEMLDRLAPGDPARQASEFTAIRLASEQNPTASNRLHYAIALGSAGHVDSNPVEARHLISELLAGPSDLRPQEILLANAYLREFDARVALYADLAREREEADRKLQSADAENDRRYNAINAETQRLRKALAEAERKLEAVAEMERTLTPPGQ
jgi:predicted ribosome quality control (RQC) complex YloA/Tae2 family protein